MNSDSISAYIRQLESNLAERNETIAEQTRTIKELQGREVDQDYRDKADHFIDLVIERYGLDRYVGDNYKLAPDRMQEIVRAMWAIRPEMKEKEGAA
jgi:hypothetical protein